MMVDGQETLIVRPLAEADLDAIAALQEASIMAFGLQAYGRRKAEAWARIGYQVRHDLLAQGTFFVAERDARLLGVGGWSPDSLDHRVAWLRYLFVHPDAIGQGVGRRLVEAAEASARAAGRGQLRVWSSLNAVGFYRALGYRSIRRAAMPLAAEIDIDYVLMARN